MKTATQRLGSNRCPERTKATLVDLLDVLPRDDDDGGRGNKGETLVTAELSSSKTGVGLDLGFVGDVVISPGRRRGGHPRPWPSWMCATHILCSCSGR